jgi:hypothetical protein
MATEVLPFRKRAFARQELQATFAICDPNFLGKIWERARNKVAAKLPECNEEMIRVGCHPGSESWQVPTGFGLSGDVANVAASSA